MSILRLARFGRLGMLLCASWVASSVGWCAGAAAQEQLRVIVLESQSQTPLERELLARLGGELAGAGFEVISLELAAGSDPAQAVVSQGGELRASAAFAARQDASAGDGARQTVLRLWFSDRVEGDLLVQDAEVAGEAAVAGTLAVQGFELLSARIAKRRLAASPAPRVAAPDPPRAPPPVPRAELSIFVNAALLYEPASGGTALTPSASVAYSPAWTRGDDIEVALRLCAAALGAPTMLEARGRRADVFQSFALLEGVFALGAQSWLRPYGALGAGVHVVRVKGVGSVPSAGRSEQNWSPVGSAGAGLALQLSPAWRLHVEAHGLFALRAAAVEIDDARAATFGRPLIVSSIGLGIAW